MQKLLVILALASVMGCFSGGDDGGGGGTAPTATVSTTVSGTVVAPGGIIAFNKAWSLNEFFTSDAYATLNGLVPVTDGTIVQLARLINGSTVSVITTATTSQGRYSFNLGQLGLQPTSDLLVRVTGSSGTQMRAFVVGSVADISPVSEAASQLIIQSLASGPFANFTLQEVSDVTGAVWLISLNQDLGTAVSLDQAVTLVKSAVGADATVMSFLTAAAQPGQTTQGTSDVGNLFPFQQGNIWRYRGRRSFSSSSDYDTTVLISGQGPAPSSGTNSTIVSETNSQGSGRAAKYYEVKDSSGIISYGDDASGDTLTRQLVPYQAVHFPLTHGVSTVLVDRTGLNWGNDEDGDGRNETFSLKLFQTVSAIESITVPAGTFDSMRVEFRAVFVVNFSRGGQATVSQLNTDWRVPGVGKVKEVISVQIEGGAQEIVLTEELEGYVVNGHGSGLRIEVTPLSISMRVGQDKAMVATAFDALNGQVVGLPFTWLSTDSSVANIQPDGTLSGVALGTASITASLGGLKSNSIPVTVSDVKVLSIATNDLVFDNVSKTLYASVPMPGTQGKVAAINPVTGAVTQSLVVGNEPDRLALSDDGQFLYVSLDNENAVKRLTLPALTTNLTFPLDNLSPVSEPVNLCGKEMKVVPGDARTVVVAVARHTIASRSCVFNDPDGVAIYQNGTKLPNTWTGFPFAHLLEFSEAPSLLFGVDRYAGSLSRFSVTASGLSLIDSNTFTNWPGRDIKFLNGLIYSASGQVVNPSTYAVIGSFTSAGMFNQVFSLRPDANSRRLFAVSVLGQDESIATVQAFDATTLSLIGSLDIPGLADTAIPQYPRYSSLVRWGSDGLAFRTSSDQVVILRSPLVGP